MNMDRGMDSGDWIDEQGIRWMIEGRDEWSAGGLDENIGEGNGRIY